MPGRYWIETLGCPKNTVDSDKLAGTLETDGYAPADDVGSADIVVVNTCAFIEAARQESIDTILALGDARRPGARLVVTGCLAERYGRELARALPEADQVAGFGVPVTVGGRRHEGSRNVPPLDLLNLPRPPARAPWAYLKVAEGCDRTCGFCAIPSFRGKQRSRALRDIVEEAGALGVAEVVLVAQDLASYGRDQGRAGAIGPLVRAVAGSVQRVRLLYLYPSDLTDGLIDVICETGLPYFDLSLQHAAKPLLRAMRRWGDGDRFLARIADIRRREPRAAFRSSFIVGYPGETEGDHDELLGFLADAQLDWAGFFAFSPEAGTYAEGLAGRVPDGLVRERLQEASELQEGITASRRSALIGETVEVLVDRPGRSRSHREAPEIDGIISVPTQLPVGQVGPVAITGAAGPDLEAVAVGAGSGSWAAMASAPDVRSRA
ncbi:MAG TPA: MiaB/RimO family radical SAM methylthiotransferase [Acidimicrobiales bacterium]